MSLYRQITPSNQPYDHYLVWLAPNGGIRQHFFSHTRGSENKSIKNYKVETIRDVRSIPEEIRVTFKLYARFLDFDTYDYVASILDSNRILKIFQDGTEIPVFIKGKIISKPNKNKSFSLSFDISLQEENILNV